MKKYYVHKKIDVLCHSLISVYEQGKKNWVLYIDHWFFFLHSVEFFENLLIHIRKEICLHFNEMMCKNLNWIVIIGWKPMCSMLNWFNDFLKKTIHCATPLVYSLQFSILKKWFRFYLKKFYLVPFKTYPLFDRKIVVSKTYKILNV